MQSRRSTITYSSARRSRPMGRNHNSVNYVSAVKLGPVTHTVLVALMITVLGLIYLTQATKATGYDYTASEIDTKISELSIAKGDLEVENARLTALANVKDTTVASTLETPTDVDYVR